MSRLLALLTFLLAALVQTTAGAGPWFFGVHVGWLLVTVTTWAIVRGPDEVFTTAPPAAILAGLLGDGPIGTPLLALLAPVGLAVLLRDAVRARRWPALALAIVASTICAFFLGLIVDFIGGDHAIDLSGFGSLLGRSVLLNLGVATMLFFPLRVSQKPQLREPTRVGLSYETEV
jgi:rod shape-determining protein MreD